MSKLNLTADEQRVLTEVLQHAISELHSEIVHTDDFDYRQMLKDRRRTLRGVLEAIEEPALTGV